jgi:hypothetical protein
MPQSPAELAKQFGGVDVSALASQFGGTPVDEPAEAPESDTLGSVINYVKGLGSEINPVTMLQGILGTLSYGSAGQAALTVGPPMAQAHVAQFQKAKELLDQGKHLQAAGHVIAGLVPLIGPPAGEAASEIEAGQTAHGLGRLTGQALVLAGPEAAGAAFKGAAGAARASGLGETVAGLAERGSTARIVDVMAPKVGANKVRFGNLAKQVAPRLAEEPGMGAFSRQGLGAKIGNKLGESEAMLDAANDARTPGELVDTSIITADLEGKLRKLMATPAEGVEANAAAKAAGVGPAMPANPPLARPFSELTSPYKAEVRRVLSEMENFDYVEPQQQFVANKGGAVGGRTPAEASRAQLSEIESSTNRTFEAGSAGAPVFHDITRGSSRGAVIDALRRYIEEEGRKPTALVQRAIDVADQRIRTPREAPRALLPLEPFLEGEAQGPLGQSSIPAPNLARAKVIMKALNDIRDLGPMAPYESLRTIRQAYDKPARLKYNPSITADFMKVSGEAEGAADVTGTLREVLSYADPKTAAANKEYSFWRKADDVMQAVEESERTRPTVGRKIMARGVGGMVGGAAGHTLGAAIGVILGPIIDGIVSAGPTTKILTARLLDDLSKSLRQGDAVRASDALRRAKTLAQSMRVAKVAGTAEEAK